MRKKNVVIVGATGLVGQTLLGILSERNFPVKNLIALASNNSTGKKLSFGNETIAVQDLARFDFKNIDFAFFTAGAEISAKYVPIAAQNGAKVIDNTSFFRYNPTIPLVVAEVNSHVLLNHPSNIIANPNCSTMQLMVALKPLYDAVGISKIIVSTYQSVSGKGQKGIDELKNQTVDLLNYRSFSPTIFNTQIAFNVIPHIDDFQNNGYTKEEMKIVWETKKILNDDDLKISATAVRVPVFLGHSEAVTIETKQKISPQTALNILRNAPGIKILDDPQNNLYPTPAQNLTNNIINHDEVFVGRIRQDLAFENGLSFWVVANNVRKGAALNSVQIAEFLL